MKMYHFKMTQSFKIVLKNNKQHEYAYCNFLFNLRQLYFVIYFNETGLRRILAKIHVAETIIRQGLVRGKRNICDYKETLARISRTRIKVRVQ